MEKIEITTADFDQVRECLELAAPFNVDRGLVGMEAMCGFGQCFQVWRNGHPVAAYNVAVREYPEGRDLFLVAAGGGARGADLVRLVVPAIEGQARAAGARTVSFTTQRQGLVRKMSALGYGVAGVNLRKWML